MHSVNRCSLTLETILDVVAYATAGRRVSLRGTRCSGTLDHTWGSLLNHVVSQAKEIRVSIRTSRNVTQHPFLWRRQELCERSTLTQPHFNDSLSCSVQRPTPSLYFDKYLGCGVLADAFVEPTNRIVFKRADSTRYHELAEEASSYKRLARIIPRDIPEFYGIFKSTDSDEVAIVVSYEGISFSSWDELTDDQVYALPLIYVQPCSTICLTLGAQPCAL